MCIGCQDPFVTYLKSVGYSPIRLPRENIAPLQLLAKYQRDLDWIGELHQLFVGTAPLPAIKPNETAADVSGQSSGELSLGVGLSLLGNLIEAMGGSKVGLDVNYKGARSIVYHFSDVLRDSVTLIELDKFLGQSDVDPHAVTTNQLLDADVVYIVTATIKSTKFTVESKTSQGTGFEVDVPVIEQVVGGKIKVSGAGAKSSTITYEGTKPLVFGFQAVQLFYSNGKYTSIKPTSVVAKALSAAPSDGRERYAAEGTFANLVSTP